MKIKKYFGVIVPMLTPINENYSIDVESLEKMLDSFLSNEEFPICFGNYGRNSIELI